MGNLISPTLTDTHSPSEVIGMVDNGDTLLVRNIDYVHSLESVAEDLGIGVSYLYDENREYWRVTIL